jgi:hypothetical protein
MLNLLHARDVTHGKETARVRHGPSLSRDVNKLTFSGGIIRLAP